jgi:hypothetical protein
LEEISLFESQAKRVSHWDMQLQQQETQLHELTDDVHQLVYYQSQTKTICDTIEVCE